MSFLLLLHLPSHVFGYGTTPKHLRLLISYRKEFKRFFIYATQENCFNNHCSTQYRHFIYHDNTCVDPLVYIHTRTCVDCVFFNRNHRRRSNCSLADFQSFVASILTRNNFDRHSVTPYVWRLGTLLNSNIYIYIYIYIYIKRVIKRYIFIP